MQRIQGAIAFGIILFFVIIGGFVGAKLEQSTLVLLGGIFIGSAVIGVVAVVVAVLMLRMNGGGRGQGERGGGYMNEEQVRRYALRMWRDDLQEAQLAAREAKMLRAGTQMWADAPAMPEPGTQLAVPQQQPAPRRSFYVVGQDGSARDLGGDF